MLNTEAIKNGCEIVLDAVKNDEIKMKNEITEMIVIIDDRKIGYCRYGIGKYIILCICGAVGCYKKDFPQKFLKIFNPDDYTIICIDPPGYGKSRPPDRQQEINRCMKDAPFCLKLMQHLDLTPFVVLGWSEGSRTAIHVAGQGKQLVKGAILLAAATRIDQRAERVFYGMRNVDQWLPDAIELYLDHYPKNFVKKQWADLCDVVQQTYSLMGGRFPSDYVLPGLKIPIMVMVGGMDRFCTDPEYFKKMISNCRVEKHLLGGHDFYLKYSRWFYDKVNEFITDPKNHFFC